MIQASLERENTPPTKAELEEFIKIDARPDRLADTVLLGGAARREKEEA